MSHPADVQGVVKCRDFLSKDGHNYNCDLPLGHGGDHYDLAQGWWRFPGDKLEDGLKANQVRITVPPNLPKRTAEIISQLKPALELFIAKQRDYTNSGGHIGDNFGFMGQYMKMHDKVAKLRKPLWDNEILKEATPETSPLQFEGTREILYDLVGHILLTLSYLEEQDD